MSEWPHRGQLRVSEWPQLVYISRWGWNHHACTHSHKHKQDKPLQHIYYLRELEGSSLMGFKRMHIIYSPWITLWSVCKRSRIHAAVVQQSQTHLSHFLHWLIFWLFMIFNGSTSRLLESDSSPFSSCQDTCAENINKQTKTATNTWSSSHFV